MGALEALTSGLVDQGKSLIDPVVKLNKRQALTQGVNLGWPPAIAQLEPSCQAGVKTMLIRTEGLSLL